MLIRQLKQEEFDCLCQSLLDHAWVQPLDPTFTVTLHLDGREYALKLQPEEGNCVAILQALRVYREEDGPNFDLVLDSPTLSQLWDQLLSATLSPAV